MRKGGDDETEGETKAEYERTVENEQGQEKKRGKAPLKIASRRERRMREKEQVMVVATSPGNGRWLKNEVIW